jgi:hypothetical protein
LKEKGALVIVPSSAVETMNLGGMAGITSIAAGMSSEVLPSEQVADEAKGILSNFDG